MAPKVAVVTGGNRGIGFEIVKGLCEKFDGVVYLTARNEERGKEAVSKLNEKGLTPLFHILDVTSEESLENFAKYLSSKYTGIDVIVNNAGILYFDRAVSNYEEAKEVIDTNFMSLLMVSKVLYPLLTNTARIVNITSDWGLLSNIKKQEWLDTLVKDDLMVDDVLLFVNDFLEAARKGKKHYLAFAGHYGDYKVSKVALTALTFVQQKQFTKEGKDISINCVHPGFVRSDMTKGMGEFTPSRGAQAPLHMALEAPQKTKGSFIWHDCSHVNWDD